MKIYEGIHFIPVVTHFGVQQGTSLIIHTITSTSILGAPSGNITVNNVNNRHQFLNRMGGFYHSHKHFIYKSPFFTLKTEIKKIHIGELINLSKQPLIFQMETNFEDRNILPKNGGLFLKERICSQGSCCAGKKTRIHKSCLPCKNGSTTTKCIQSPLTEHQ